MTQMQPLASPCDCCPYATIMSGFGGSRYVLCDPKHWKDQRCAGYLLAANAQAGPGRPAGAPRLAARKRCRRSSWSNFPTAWLVKLRTCLL